MSIRSLPKSALAALAACGISVASTAPTTSPTFTPPTLTQRIDTVRSKLMALEAAAVAPQELGAQRQAQQTLDLAWNNCWQNCWNNWQNWNNWHNCWSNWNNWQNWSNCWRNC